MKLAVRGAGFVLAFIFLLFVIGIAYFWAQKLKPEQKSVEAAQQVPQTITVGQMGIIYTGLPGATTEEAYEQIVKLVKAKNQTGIDQLIESGSAIYVEDDTRVKVIGTALFKKRVWLVDGDHEGTAVWVPSRYVFPE